MRFARAATKFDTQEFFDAYTGVFAFYGQLLVYSLSTRDSLTGQRRLIGVGADVLIPERRAVTLDSNVFILGDVVPDYFKSQVVRQTVIAHPVFHGSGQYGAAAAFLSSGSLVEAYLDIAWRKDSKDEQESAYRYNVYNAYLAASESVSRGQVVCLDGKYYRVANETLTTGGFLVVEMNEILGGVRGLSITQQGPTYDPVSDSYTGGSALVVQGFVERPSDNYRYIAGDFEKYRSGDKIVTVAATDVTPREGDKVTVDSDTYQVIGAIDDGNGAWECHVRAYNV